MMHSYSTSSYVVFFSIIIIILFLTWFSIRRAILIFRQFRLEKRLKENLEFNVLDFGIGDDAIKTPKGRPRFRWPLSRIVLWFSLIMLMISLVTLAFEFTTVAFTSLTSIYFVGAALILLSFALYKNHRRKVFVEQLPSAMESMAQAVAAGRTIVDAIGIIGEKYQGLLGEEFRKIKSSTAIGTSYLQAVRDSAYRLGIIEFYYFSIIIIIHHRTGGKMVGLLNNLADALYKKKAAEMKIKALSGEAKMSMSILGLLPWISLGIVTLVSYDYISPLFYDETGRTVLVCAVVSEFVGFFLLKRFTKIEI